MDVARPEKLATLDGLMADTPAPAQGNLRSYGDAGLNSDGKAIRTVRLDRLRSFDAQSGVLDVEAGATISQILSVFAPQGFMPAVMPGTGFATIGGAIAHDVHGKNHHSAGSFAEHVESIDLIGADGTCRTVSRQTEAGTFHATLGGAGQTGVIRSAKIRLAPCPSGTMRVTERRVDGLEPFLTLLDGSRASFTVGWIDLAATGSGLGRGVLEEAEFAPATADGHDRLKPGRTVPFDAPRFALSRPIVRTFNAFYFHRIRETGQERDRPLQDFFFPLDRLHDWNRFYGKTGFRQFQCVLPEESAAGTLQTMLEEITASGLASPLAVLKKLGKGAAGPLSFPMPGFTLAVDIPNRDGTMPLMDRLHRLTAEAGGRIYLAKDSCLDAALLPDMYPDLDRFRKTVSRLDPDGLFETDLSRRLNLRGTA
ncbi:FAD-binding oxidoreductase [Oceanomicrobium pacificus]|nr:FAD-binding oxidoreductase [Oceanomicrobium pacificus]